MIAGVRVGWMGRVDRWLGGVIMGASLVSREGGLGQ